MIACPDFNLGSQACMLHTCGIKYNRQDSCNHGVILFGYKAAYSPRRIRLLRQLLRNIIMKIEVTAKYQHHDVSFSNFIVKNSTTIFSVPSKHMRV